MNDKLILYERGIKNASKFDGSTKYRIAKY